MHLAIERVSEERVECFLNLWQFLGYDFSAMNQMPLRSNGTYALPKDIEAYYSDERYISYLVSVEGELAGFAVIKRLDGENNFYFRHFFVMRKFRGLGIGASAACSIFDEHRGSWQVSQFDYNVSATAFWRKVLALYTKNEFIDERRPDDKGPQQRFINK